MASDKMKAIYKVTDTHVYGFFDRHRYLSNFHLQPVIYESIMYPSNESAYHAAKLIPGSEQPPIAINGQLVMITREHFVDMDPSQAKATGRKINLRHDWLAELPQEDQVTDPQGALILQVRDKIMYDLNWLKFTQNSGLAQKLKETEELYLEETNWWNDDYWGVFEGEGLNKLGRILMMIRSNLIKRR